MIPQAGWIQCIIYLFLFMSPFSRKKKKTQPKADIKMHKNFKKMKKEEEN